MCQHHTDSSQHLEFTAFCVALRRWLLGSLELDPPLAAAVELLGRRGSRASDPPTWFECEITHVAWNAEDMHAALGAGVVLSLWNASRTGHFSLP
jgi:hypothetical protein